MVWKNVKKPTEREAEHISKRAVKVKTNSMFYNAHTRESIDLNQQKECKITVEKKLTKEQLETYNQMLEEQRIREEAGKKRKNATTAQ